MGGCFMAKSNRERVGEIMDLLKSGLAPFVLGQYKSRYRGRYLKEMELQLYNAPFSVSLPDEARAMADIDTQGWLRLMFYNWNEAFKDKLGHSERSYASILMDARNQWAHQGPITNDDAQHVADIAKRLLHAVGAKKEADIAAAHAVELQRELLERDANKSVRQQRREASAQDAFTRRTPVGLKPWRQVVQPHPDVRKGQYTLSEFSADLAQVVQGKAMPEYGDAQEFFQRTFLTRGLQDLIVNCILRLNGQGADPVVQLQTNFGGGKTHSLLALYHLAGGIRLRDIPGAEAIVERIGAVDDFIKCQRAVIVGTDFDGVKPRDHKDCTTHNLWGEIAYQLGGLPAYEMVKEADQAGVSPGSSTLLALMEQHGPALIIIDELVAHARNLYNAKGGRYAANFDAIMTFVQSLTEAVRRASDALLLVSLPVSELEAGGAGGKEAMDFVSKTLGRMESVWKPVDTDESYEIVRRRLFADQIDRPARDAVVRAFNKMYRDSPAEFPKEAGEQAYLTRMEQAYPIHPELFDRLYEDWSTLEGFQQTRGVLRLMATVIHRLWDDEDFSLLIMPGFVPLWNGKVREEILRYLPGNWPAIIDQDIDGDRSRPRQQDRERPRFQELSASRRVARAVFMGSAPSVRAQPTRGLTQEDVHLATVQPGESPAVFNDALRHMSDSLSYLYRNDARFWYDVRPTLNRTAADLARSMEDYRVLAEAGERLRAQQWDRNFLGSVHFLPENSAEIPDEQRARVVVLGPNFTHKRNDDASSAMQEISEIMVNRGNSPRHHRNTLVFIAPDESRNAEWSASIRRYLAWRSIEADKEAHNLDIQQSRQVEEAVKRESETVDKQLQETYCWLIVPDQPSPTDQVEYATKRIRLSQNFLDGAARELKSNAWLIHFLSPNSLMMDLEPLGIWKEAPHLSVKRLWEWLTNYCYLPRLADRDVLEATIKAGLEGMFPLFAYATGVDEAGKYSGLKLKGPVTLYFDQHDLLVDPHVARAQAEAELDARQPEALSLAAADGKARAFAPVGPVDEPSPALPKPKRRYFGSVQIDPQRARRDLNQIADEVIVLLASAPGADVNVTVEIEAARADGFDDATRRAVDENSRTLNFRAHDFED